MQDASIIAFEDRSNSLLERDGMTRLPFYLEGVGVELRAQSSNSPLIFLSVDRVGRGHHSLQRGFAECLTGRSRFDRCPSHRQHCGKLRDLVRDIQLAVHLQGDL